MGIFGFLSKAHLEQNLASDTLIQRIQILEDKIESEKMSIERQTLVINRAEKAISRDTGTASGDIEVQQSIIADANEKLKTLLTVETNTVRDLNDRLKVLDKNVSDVLTSNKSFFNEEKAAADLKASQKEERAEIAIKVKEAQVRIAELKADHKQEIAKAQEIIANMRSGSQDNKGQFTKEIENAERKIFDSQGRIDLFIVEKQPLEKEMLTLEAEIGPVKYIAALAVDWGITDQVETSKAVRWVILLLIVVFDPLAVLLLIAANQSLMRRFPPEPPKPEEVLDLEKPDDDELTLKWNEMMDKANAEANATVKMDQATAQLKDWKEKLESFNAKVPKPDAEAPVEIIQEDTSVPHVDLKGGPKPTIQDGFDPDEVMFDMETVPKVDKEKQLEEFKKREEEERKALEEYSRKAREDEEEQTISEQIEEAMEPERIKPDFTEVLEPEVAVEPKETIGTLGTVLVKNKKVVQPPKPNVPEQTTPAEMTDEERTGMLNKFHNLHGKYEDISDEELKVERDQSNRAQFLADVSLTKEQAAEQGPITESRMAFFQDMIDDILRGDTTFENVPEENRKIIAQIMDPDIDNPQIITKGSALKEQHPDGLEEMSAEGLKEKFMISPQTEERPMTDDELDELLEGFEDDKPKGKTRMVIKDGKKIFVPVEGEYVQNEEQTEETKWEPVKELDLPEPEKNEIILPDLPTTDEENVPDMADSIQIESTIPQDKFTKYKKRLTSEEDYHQRVEARINDLITKLENGEVKLNDLTQEDQQVIMDILNQNG